MEKQMPCPTQRIDESICGMADCTPDVYRDLFATLDKGKHKNNNKMDCQPYRKRRPATQKGGVFA